MNEYVDKKFISLLSNRVRNFKWKSATLANFSCPICGDSATNKSKARGFCILHKGRYYYKCHNCQYSTTIGSLLKKLDSTLYSEYLREIYKNNSSDNKVAQSEPVKVVQTPQIKPDILRGATCVNKLDASHPCRIYLDSRKIPKLYHRVLYYTDDFRDYAEDHFDKADLVPNDKRLIIPFFDRNGKTLIGLQGRAIDPDAKIRYVTLRHDENKQLLYGLERVDFSKQINVVEGPLDSLFVPNCIGMATAGKKIDLPTLADNIVMIYDNEPRNKQIVDYMQKSIDHGYRLCVWPNTIKEKDINDMVIAGTKPAKIYETICTHTYSGLLAKLKLQEWKKA